MTYYGAVAIVEAASMQVPPNVDHVEVVRLAIRMLDDVEFRLQRQRLISKGSILGEAEATKYSQLNVDAAAVVRSMSQAAKTALRKRTQV